MNSIMNSPVSIPFPTQEILTYSLILSVTLPCCSSPGYLEVSTEYIFLNMHVVLWASLLNACKNTQCTFQIMSS